MDDLLGAERRQPGPLAAVCARRFIIARAVLARMGGAERLCDVVVERREGVGQDRGEHLPSALDARADLALPMVHDRVAQGSELQRLRREAAPVDVLICRQRHCALSMKAEPTSAALGARWQSRAPRGAGSRRGSWASGWQKLSARIESMGRNGCHSIEWKCCEYDEWKPSCRARHARRPGRCSYAAKRSV